MNRFFAVCIFAALFAGFAFAAPSAIYPGCDSKFEKKISYYLSDNEIEKAKLKALDVSCVELNGQTNQHYLLKIAGEETMIFDPSIEPVEGKGLLNELLKKYFISDYVKYDFGLLDNIVDDANTINFSGVRCFDDMQVKAYNVTFRNKAYIAKILLARFPRGSTLDSISQFPVVFSDAQGDYVSDISDLISQIANLKSKFSTDKDSEAVKAGLKDIEAKAIELKSDISASDEASKPYGTVATDVVRCVKASCKRINVCIFTDAAAAADRIISASNEAARSNIPNYADLIGKIVSNTAKRKTQAQVIQLYKQKFADYSALSDSAKLLQAKYVKLGVNLKEVKVTLAQLQTTLDDISKAELVSDAQAKSKVFDDAVSKYRQSEAAYNKEFSLLNDSKYAVDRANLFIIAAQKVMADNPKLPILKKNATALQVVLSKNMVAIEDGKLPTEMALRNLTSSANEIQAEVTGLVRPEDEIDISIIIGFAVAVAAIVGIVLFLKLRGSGSDIQKEIEIQKLKQIEEKKSR